MNRTEPEVFMVGRCLGVLVVVACVLAAAAAPARAEWRSDLAIYGWAAGLDGKAGVGSVEADIDKSFSDILDDLQFAGMAGYSGSDGSWAFQADVVIANLGATARGQQGALRADIDADMTILEADIGWEATDTARIFAGARYVDLTNKVELRIANQVFKGRRSDTWVDPVIGFRLSSRRGERVGFWLRGDVGGFGAGSDFAWNASAGVSYRIQENLSLGAGYRILDIKYDKGNGANRFLYDAQMAGFVTGAAFSW